MASPCPRRYRLVLVLGRCSAGWWDSVGRRPRVRRLACGAVLAVLVAAVWTSGNAFGASPAPPTSSASSRSVHGRGTAQRDVAHVVTPDLRPERSRQRGAVPPAVLAAAIAAVSVAATSVRRATVARLAEARAVSTLPRAPPLLVS